MARTSQLCFPLSQLRDSARRQRSTTVYIHPGRVKVLAQVLSSETHHPASQRQWHLQLARLALCFDSKTRFHNFITISSSFSLFFLFFSSSSGYAVVNAISLAQKNIPVTPILCLSRRIFLFTGYMLFAESVGPQGGVD